MKHLTLLAALAQLAAAQYGSSSGGSSGGQGGTSTASAQKSASTGGSRQAQSQGSSSSSSAAKSPSNILNDHMARDLLLGLTAVVVTIFTYRIILHTVQYIRTLTCMNNDRQRYFVLPNMGFARAKKYILYAPMFRTRHNREFRLSSAMNMGILPTRFQSIFLTAIVAMNVTLCVFDIPWKSPEQSVLPLLRKRTGTLATVNLIPLVLMVGRNNPLIGILNISFDSFNLIHHWFGRLVALEGIAHAACWIIAEVQKAGRPAVQKQIEQSNVILTGLVSTIAVVAILLQTPSVVRHAFYETFLHLHNALVIVFMIFLYMHLDGRSQQNYLIVAITFWAAERTARLMTIIYRNMGAGSTKATIEALPGDAMRVSLKLARPWSFRPGQHMYIYIPSVGLWTSHPFSCAWSDVEERLTDEKGLAMTRQDVLAMHKTTVSAILRRRTGMTNKLYEKAEKDGIDGKITLTAFVEGPYGPIRPLHSYGTVLMFAGGVGITHQVPHVRDLVAGYANGTVAARKVVLVWIIQAPEHLEWIRPWMTSILGMEKRRDILKILLFVTRPRSTKEIHSPSATVQMFPGRPNVDTLIGMESENQVGAMGVSVCGTGSLQDDVRAAVRKRQGDSNVDFVEESFSW